MPGIDQVLRKAIDAYSDRTGTLIPIDLGHHSGRSGTPFRLIWDTL